MWGLEPTERARTEREHLCTLFVIFSLLGMIFPVDGISGIPPRPLCYATVGRSQSIIVVDVLRSVTLRLALSGGDADGH